jgi:hypothetical protein
VKKLGLLGVTLSAALLFAAAPLSLRSSPTKMVSPVS